MNLSPNIHQSTETPPPSPRPRRQRRRKFDPTLSAAIDRAVAQLEAADDPAVAAAWRSVLDGLLDGIDRRRQP